MTLSGFLPLSTMSLSGALPLAALGALPRLLLSALVISSLAITTRGGLKTNIMLD